MFTRKFTLLIVFIAMGAVLFTLKSNLQTPALAPVEGVSEPMPLVLAVSHSDFLRYCNDLDDKAACASGESSFQYFQSYLEKEMLFEHALRTGLLWRDPVVQRLVLSNQEFLEIERMTDALLDDMVRSDMAIRRHIVRRAKQLMGYAKLSEPNEQELREYYREHADQFLTDARVDLVQRIYTTLEEALQALTALDSMQVQPRGASGSSLPGVLQAADRRDIGRYFGYVFADNVFDLAIQADPTGAWLGPVQSSHGFHLVKLKNYRPPAAAPYGDEIRNRVRGAWQEEQRAIAYSAQLRRLKSDSLVVFEDGAPVKFSTLTAIDLQPYF